MSEKSFRVTEIAAQLSDELRQEFQELIDSAKSNDQAASEKLKALLEKEHLLDQEKIRLEKENAEFRQQVRKQQEQMSQELLDEKRNHQEELANIKSKLENSYKELHSYRSGKSELLSDYETSKQNWDKNLSSFEEVFQTKFEEMTLMMEKIARREEEVLSKKEKNTRESRTDTNNLKELAEHLRKLAVKLETEVKNLGKEKQQLRQTLDDEFKEKNRALKEEFILRSKYHVKRMQEMDREAEHWIHEKSRLQVKEQTLALDSRIKVSDLMKENLAELAERKHILDQLQSRVLKEEKEIEKDKLMLTTLLASKQPDAKELSLLKTTLKAQARVLSRKTKLVEAMEQDHRAYKESLDRQLQQFEDDRKQSLANLQQEGLAFTQEQKRLRQKELDLVKRETYELKTLNEEYEELKDSLEVSYIEKMAELEEQEENMRKEQEQCMQNFSGELEIAKRSLEGISDFESQAIDNLKEIQQLGDESLKQQEEVGGFLQDIKNSLQENIDSRSADYELFQNKISDIEDLSSKLQMALKDYESKADSEEAEKTLQNQLSQQESILDTMEQELRSKVDKYSQFIKDFSEVKASLINEDESRQTEFRETLKNYENKLSHIGQAFENLSQSFQSAKDAEPPEPYPAGASESASPQFNEVRTKAEWPLVVQHRLELGQPHGKLPHIDENIYKDISRLADQADQWVNVPSGKFSLPQNGPASKAGEIEIPHSFRIHKFPVSNVEYYQFVHETGYKTEAEDSINGIVYHNGVLVSHDKERNLVHNRYSNPTLAPDKSAYWLCPNGKTDSLYLKYDHPVTQVTWNDAQAFCEWKSAKLDKTVRLPSFNEWMYLASNLGQGHSEDFLTDKKSTVKFCNIDETGIGDTTANGVFPENNNTGKAQDLFGNVYEWAQDSHRRKSSSAQPAMEHKIVLGGSFITHFKHLWPHHPLTFLPSYCTSFLGFRILCEK